MRTLSIIALPDPATSRLLRRHMDELSRQTGSIKALAFPPHFTLWGAFKVKDAHVGEIERGLAQIGVNMEPLQLSFSDYGFYPWKVVYLDIAKEPAVCQIHNQIMEVVQQYRTPWVPAALLANPHMTTPQHEATKKYGYQFAGEYFSPHITLSGNDMSETSFQQVKHRLEHQSLAISATVDQFVLIDLKDGSRLTRSFRLG